MTAGRIGDHTRRGGGRWGYRTIKSGGVIRWRGKDYRVDATALHYDGKLDGKRALFFTYGGSYSKDAVFLHSFPGTNWPGPNCINGVFRWDEYLPLEVGK